MSEPMRTSVLRPDETIQKFLISTTSRFVGEHVTETLELNHAWPGIGDVAAAQRLDPGPLSRSAYVLLLRTSPLNKQVGAMIPRYDHIAEIVCAYLCVLFGKRFDSHGSLEWSGMFGVPNMTAYATPCVPQLPWNTHRPRTDGQLELNLTEFRRFAPLLDESLHEPKRLEAFVGAARFYGRALQAAESDPEVAYLHLITAGEVLAAATDVDASTLIDDQIAADLSAIEGGLPDGPRIAKRFRGRLRQIKRRFVATIDDLVDPAFFERTEATEPWAALKAETFRKALGAAYNLRSRHVHIGAAFGRWINPTRLQCLNEVQFGQPVVDDQDWAKVLATAPTFIGLERILRYSLLQFAGRLGADITVQP
jgi:hypothetical protein